MRSEKTQRPFPPLNCPMRSKQQPPTRSSWASAPGIRNEEPPSSDPSRPPPAGLTPGGFDLPRIDDRSQDGAGAAARWIAAKLGPFRAAPASRRQTPPRKVASPDFRHGTSGGSCYLDCGFDWDFAQTFPLGCARRLPRSSPIGSPSRYIEETPILPLRRCPAPPFDELSSSQKPSAPFTCFQQIHLPAMC